jgi:hypothetical protein
MLFAAASALALAFSTPVDAATLADLKIETAITGTNVSGAPTTATITGQIDYETFFLELARRKLGDHGLQRRSRQRPELQCRQLHRLRFGVNAVLNLTSGQTGTLNFIANGGTSPLFSFNLSGLFTANG